TRDPRAVQPHLSKCFEGICRLKFTGELKNLSITHFYSSEGEEVKFQSPITPSGDTEAWMNRIQDNMKSSLRTETRMSLEEYRAIVPNADYSTKAKDERIGREKWLLSWPAQVILTIDQVIWAQEVTQALNDCASSARQSVKRYSEELLTRINRTVDLIRSGVSKRERSLLTAILTIDVHAQAVVYNGLYCDAAVTSPSDFPWMSQLRYYWEDDGINVKQVNACLPYAWEYLGVGSRLVITPLTDRCYMTLTSALHLHLGGSPQGPA
ncbi:dynein heavy chain, partial [Kipferlia bialata]